ncbi:hypothetical protein BCR42DRAFT_446871 [Absidia repens]|uniref:Uncharacterized protein n=1 Tax=Absidia repens TaxID=90262 RepID=A0A1X2IVT9_9FUNG|nr:hypothetical protein BCR42DRAFT_446871 [Absidia repens]
MGLLKKLPSFSKKSRPKPSDRPPLPSSPPVEPLSLKLDFEDLSQQQNITNTTIDFNRSSNANCITSSAAENALAPDATNTATPNAGASLLDDIFSELNQNQASPHQDSLKADISLAFALSQQLQLDTTPSQQQQPQQQQTLQPQVKELSASNTLFGQDSIYSSYINDLQREDGDQSMFASLLQPIPGSTLGSSTNTAISPLTLNRSTPISGTAAITATATTAKKDPLPTQIVLDSDVSGTEDDDDDDQTSGGEETNSAEGKQRRTLGACPIMERRPHDHRLNVARNVDRWADHVEENVVESNQSMLNRMKDRHRQQVKLQAMRQQQQKHQKHQQQQAFPPTNMMYPNAAMGSMMMPPPTGMNSMLCTTVPPISMISSPISASVVPMHGSTSMPPSLDSTLTPNYQPALTVWASEHSSSPRRSVATSSASSVDNTPRSSTSTVTNSTTKLTEDQENMNNSSIISEDDKEDDKKDKKEPEPATTKAIETTEENTNDYDDADDEADDEDKTKTSATVNKRRSISTKKPSPSSSSIRHSRSVPDLKKKKRKSTRTNQQTPASAPHSAVPSPSSSTPTSTSTPYSVTTPPLPSSSPIPPLPQQKHASHDHHRPHQHNNPYGLKSMKSEPDMKRHSMNQHVLPQTMMPQALYQQQQQQHQQLLIKQQQQLHQQQQLQLEWERMQLYQREQQLKQEFLQLHQRSSQIHRSTTLPTMSSHLQQPLDPRLYPSYYSGTH